MPTLQLQVEVDGDAHPELFALLSGVKPSLRAERLRQLAAGGVIWEHLRLQPRIEHGASPRIAEEARAADGAALQKSAARARPPAAPPREAPPVLQDVVELATQPPKPPAPDAPAPPEPAAGEAPAARKSGPRSRLMLMKERGLFQNG